MRKATTMFLISLFFVFTASRAAAPSTITLMGTVTDPSGVALSSSVKPRVLVHWDPSGADAGLKSNVGIPKDLAAEPDAGGAFQLALPPGFYDIFVTAMGFSPRCDKIRIESHRVLKLNVKLSISRTVARELADRPF